MANPVTFSPMATEQAPRPAKLPDLPLPANAQAPAGPNPVLAALAALAGQRGSQRQSVVIEAELLPALEDMQAGSGRQWQEWLNGAVNEALRYWLGR